MRIVWNVDEKFVPLQPILGAVIAVSYIEVPMNRLRLMRGRCLLLVLLPLILLAACDDGVRQRLQLKELELMNRADSLMTNDSLALDLADWFDRHGTPNEQLRAHYILGRTYADLGEAPQAIEAYNDAIDRADTTDVDCNYYTLCRVYTQMANVYYHQDLYQDQLSCLDQAIYYGYLATDTLSALLAYAQKMGAYDMLMKPDSMLYVCESVSKLFRQAGYLSKAADVLCFPVRYLCDQDSLEKARRFLGIYERESGFFDAENNIESGREVYYFYKGYYYLKTYRNDSAEFFFRKELAMGKDFNNQNAGALGLALLYQQIHKPDSAAKYALYSYVMNDSVYAHEATAAVAKMKSMYDYTRYERQAHIERESALQSSHRFVLASIFAGLLLFAILLLIREYQRVQKKRDEEAARYKQLQEDHQRTEEELSTLLSQRQNFLQMSEERKKALADNQQAADEILRLKQSEQALTDLISQKEADLARQETELLQYKQKSKDIMNALSSEEALLQKLPNYISLVEKTNRGQRLSENDWKVIRMFVREELPQFHDFIKVRQRQLTDYEVKMSLLVRLYFKPKNIATALGVDSSYVTRVRRSMLKKMFAVSGKSKDVDIMIRQIDHLKNISFEQQVGS